MGLSMALILIFEFKKSSLYGITRYRLSKTRLKVKYHFFVYFCLLFLFFVMFTFLPNEG